MSDITYRVRPTIDSRVERQIITYMVVNDEFLNQIRPVYDQVGGLKGRMSGHVARWCLEYYEHYDKAPQQHIQELFETHKPHLDEVESEAIAEFLSGLSEEYERQDKVNIPYLLDEAEKYFRTLSLTAVKDELGMLLAQGRLDEAENRVAEYNRVSRPQSNGVDLIHDVEFAQDVFMNDSAFRLFKMPGILGYYTDPIERGHLIGLAGATGIGKSWWLWFFAQVALFQGINVVFIDYEMSLRQRSRRAVQSLTGLPLPKHAGKILIPKFDCYRNQINECKEVCAQQLYSPEGQKPVWGSHNPHYKLCSKCRGDNNDRWQVESWYEVIEKPGIDFASAGFGLNRILKTHNRIGKLHLASFPEQSMTVADLKTYLKNLMFYENFDNIGLVVTDYADKMRPKYPGDPYRHRINELWSGHKSIAQEFHCCVITGSQTNTSRTGKDAGRGDWAEAIGKLELADLGIILNQSPADKENSMMRIFIGKKRHDDYDLKKELKVLQQLRIGQPYLDATESKMEGKKK